MKKILTFCIVVFVLFFLVKTIPCVAFLGRLVFDDGAKLQSSNNRTNILILGVGGGSHEGGDLTDTMMVVSLDNTKKTLAMISVPRDIWSDTLKDKVNSAYHYGKLLMAKVTVEDVLGIPIHYAVVLDFSGFQNVIDEVGGIEVNVPTAFTDKEYPCETDTCVYETVHFDAGPQHMDGARALIYARSRHAEGDEGSDFARSRRQQEIMLALKNRVMHPWQWFTFARIKDLPKVIDDATDMDMTVAQALTIAKRFIGTRQGDSKKISFDDQLESPPSYLYGRYVLVPKEDWDTIHAFIKNQLER